MTKATDYEHAFKPYLYSLMPFIGGGAYDPPPQNMHGVLFRCMYNRAKTVKNKSGKKLNLNNQVYLHS